MFKGNSTESLRFKNTFLRDRTVICHETSSLLYLECANALVKAITECSKRCYAATGMLANTLNKICLALEDGVGCP